MGKNKNTKQISPHARENNNNKETSKMFTCTHPSLSTFRAPRLLPRSSLHRNKGKRTSTITAKFGEPRNFDDDGDGDNDGDFYNNNRRRHGKRRSAGFGEGGRGRGRGRGGGRIGGGGRQREGIRERNGNFNSNRNYNSREGNINPFKVMVGNLSYSTTDETLGRAMERFGYVANARVVLDRETGQSRGFGFVTFEDEASCAECVEIGPGMRIDDREVKVEASIDKNYVPTPSFSSSIKSQRRYNNFEDDINDDDDDAYDKKLIITHDDARARSTFTFVP